MEPLSNQNWILFANVLADSTVSILQIKLDEHLFITLGFYDMKTSDR